MFKTIVEKALAYHNQQHKTNFEVIKGRVTSSTQIEGRPVENENVRECLLVGDRINSSEIVRVDIDNEDEDVVYGKLLHQIVTKCLLELSNNKVYRLTNNT